MSVFQAGKLNIRTISSFQCSVNLTYRILKCSYQKLTRPKSTFTDENNFEHQASLSERNKIASADLISCAKNVKHIKRSNRRKETINEQTIYWDGVKSANKWKKKRIESKGEILYGTHPVYLALLQKKRDIYELFIRVNKGISVPAEKNIRMNKIEQLAKTLNIPICNLSSKEMENLAPGAIHQVSVISI
ncbi:rRNA methyltransferase 1, mitochondrial [Caerostris darwini]|uniref:rRNA methyltransferase 1, mitochondrial n=1 Tax=Caerostris darwini TaxID=1538125 RepID=A0AAV4MCC3_9ARAC|nr:rRNA methyltransferase 1, mitochondrial [Caerostris darwini]